MWNKLLSAALLLRRPILIALAFMAVLIVVCLILCRDFHWRSAKMTWFGLLVGLPGRDLYRLSASWARLAYTVGVAFCFTELEPPHYLLLLLLCLPFDLVKFSPLRLLFAVLNGGVLGAALFAGNLLLVYMREVHLQTGVLVMYLLLELFLCLYAAYLTLRDVQQLAMERVSGKGGVYGEA